MEGILLPNTGFRFIYCCFIDLDDQGKKRLHKIETALPIAHNFQTYCGRLLEWLDKVEPAIESTKAEQASETEVWYIIGGQ